MKQERIDEIANLLDSLSLRGKWEIFRQLNEKGNFSGQFNIRGVGGGLVAGDIVGILEPADATFMAASPQIMRELLEEVREKLPASSLPNHCPTCGQYDANQCGGMG